MSHPAAKFFDCVSRQSYADFSGIKELIVEQEEKERLERGVEAELNRRCGDGTVQKVEVL